MFHVIVQTHSLFLSLSIHSIEIQVDYFERDEGILTKVLETVVSANDVPLSQTFQEDKSLAEVNNVTSVYTHTCTTWALGHGYRSNIYYNGPNCM